MIQGSCLCGGIRYEYHGEIDEISICHCTQCRKAQGSAFAAVSPIDSARFRIVAGVELLKEFRATPDKTRVFCSRCGSPVYSARDDLPQVKRLRLGTVDTPFTCGNIYHIFADFKASWLNFDETHPCFAERRP